MIQRLRKWALQDSNLRPSDYETVDPLKSHNNLRGLHSGAQRQAATTLATSRQPDATHSATRFEVPSAIDRLSLRLQLLVPGLL
jgi:hypothetical protein